MLEAAVLIEEWIEGREWDLECFRKQLNEIETQFLHLCKISEKCFPEARKEFFIRPLSIGPGYPSEATCRILNVAEVDPKASDTLDTLVAINYHKGSQNQTVLSGLSFPLLILHRA